MNRDCTEIVFPSPCLSSYLHVITANVTQNSVIVNCISDHYHTNRDYIVPTGTYIFRTMLNLVFSCVDIHNYSSSILS